MQARLARLTAALVAALDAPSAIGAVAAFERQVAADRALLERFRAAHDAYRGSGMP